MQREILKEAAQLAELSLFDVYGYGVREVCPQANTPPSASISPPSSNNLGPRYQYLGPRFNALLSSARALPSTRQELIVAYGQRRTPSPCLKDEISDAWVWNKWPYI